MLSKNIKKLSRLEDHPKNLTTRIRAIAKDLNNVAFSEDINDLSSARILTMPAIWGCLREGEVQLPGLEIEDDEVRGAIHHHSHEGLVKLSFALIQNTQWIEVLSASIEVK